MTHTQDGIWVHITDTSCLILHTGGMDCSVTPTGGTIGYTLLLSMSKVVVSAYVLLDGTRSHYQF